MSTPKWFQYKEWSGIAVRGVVPFDAPRDPHAHMDRVVFLTSRLEAPSWGSVQGYDGAGMSAGLLHNIAVAPRSMEQGSLFALVRRMADLAPNSRKVATLLWLFSSAGITLARDGKLRSNGNGVLISGEVVRGLISPPNGKVPRKGAHYDAAVAWATAFHEAFSDAATFSAQQDYAIDWLCAGSKADEIAIYRRYTGMAQLDSPVALQRSQLPPAVELAMCVYHSFSVNGPAPAATALRGAAAARDPETFARQLIRRLGKSTFGKWQDEPGEGTRSRYDKTRRAVWARADLWDGDVARRLMPRDLG